MNVPLNGALGIGKSTLGEALSESVPKCVTGRQALSLPIRISDLIATQRWLGNSQAAPDNSGAGQGVVPLLGQQIFRTRDA